MAHVLEPAVMVPPVRLIVPEPEVAPVTEPLQELVKPGALATTRPAGKVSETATPVSAALPAGLVIVIVRTEFVLVATLVGAKAFAIVVAALTVNVAVAVVPVPPFVEVTALVVLTDAPVVLEVTVAVTVQLPLVAIDAPLMTTDVDVEDAVLPPTHVVANPEAVIPAGKLSVIPTPVRATVADGLVIVIVSVDVPPGAMDVGEKALPTVGGATTVKVAVAAVPVTAFVEVTVLVVLALAPEVVPVTVTEAVQVPLAAIVPPLKLIVVAPEVGLNVGEPQALVVAPGVVKTWTPVGRGSENATPVNDELVELLTTVNVSVEVPLTGMELGAKALVNVGATAFTTRLLLALVTELVPQPPAVVVDAVTVKGVVAAGVAPVVVIVRTDVVVVFVTVVGRNAAVAPAGAVQLIDRAFEVQACTPAHVVLIAYVAEEPAVTGLGVCAPAVTAVMVSGVGAVTVSVWVGALLKAPVPVAVITGLPAVVSDQ